MPNTQTISIVIPTYNMSWCLKRAIESCLSQDLMPQEIIVVDDASSDNTASLMRRLVKIHPQVKYLKLPHNSGAAEAMMSGVRAARSEWVAFLDADDELTANSLSSRMKVVRHYPRPNKLGMVYGNVYVRHGHDLQLVTNKLIMGQQYPYLTRELSLCQQIVMLVRRNFLLSSGYPTIKLASSTDDDMMLTLAKSYEIAYTTDPVAIINLHTSDTRMTNNLFSVAQGTAGLISKYRADIIHYHGYWRLFLWYLRLLRRHIEAKIQLTPNPLARFCLRCIYVPLQWIVVHTFDIHWL